MAVLWNLPKFVITDNLEKFKVIQYDIFNQEEMLRGQKSLICDWLSCHSKE